jgi:hypothetical protein
MMKIVLYAVTFIVAMTGVTAETVLEKIKRSGMDDTLGTTPEQAGAADSAAFPNLPDRTYWMTKHTFNKVTERWNDARKQEAKGGATPPLNVSDIFRDMVRNEYLHALNKAWPTITPAKYGAGAARTKRIVTDGNPDIADKTGHPRPGDAPNDRLARHLQAFYDEWLIEKKDDTPSVFQRFVAPLLQGTGPAPLLGTSRDYKSGSSVSVARLQKMRSS